MKKIKKAKKAKIKKVKTKALVEAPKKRGRPRKEDVAPKKRGRPRKEDVAPKKRGRKAKVVKETNREKMQKVAKLGKRKYKKAVEDMAMEKIGKKMRRKRNGYGNGNSGISEILSSRVYSYEKYSKTAAGPNVAPVGITAPEKKKAVKETETAGPFLDKIKQRLVEKGYSWKASTFKVVEKTPTAWTVEFVDKKQGTITSINGIAQHKIDEEIEEKIEGRKKTPKLSKIELNRYIKRMIARGLRPKNIKVLENTPEYFKIEFNDGESKELTTASHVKAWEEL
jgi:hypothetical protein